MAKKYINFLERRLEDIDSQLEFLYQQKQDIQNEIDLYEEDWHGYEYEELENIENNIRKFEKEKKKLENKFYG